MIERHRAIMRILKAWAWRVGGDPAYAKRVSVSEALADDVIEAVMDHDLLRDFDPPDDPEALKRRALERARLRNAKPRLRDRAAPTD
jgi:hypothetical protein